MIRFQGVTKRFTDPTGGAQAALADLDLEVRAGETLCLIGGSGSGKTTALRLINRLHEADAGRVLVDGLDVREQDPIRLRRGIGYVVQSGALFPHLTVADNIGLLCELEGWAPREREARIDQLMELVRMPRGEFGDRYPRELSGGQQQRIGVARALALRPPIVLLDEPFGALDPITRRELQDEFRGLMESSERTMVLVTHDLAEAFLLGDRIALLHAGRLLQVGTPRELVEHPADSRVADFVAEQGGDTLAGGAR